MAINKYPTERRQRPHTVVTVDSSGIGSSSANTDKAIVILGSAKGGQPNVPYQLTSYPQAKDIFRSGTLLDGIELAWNASDAGIGAGTIYAVRVDEASQATLDQDPVIFTSLLYGADANQLTLSLEDNALTATKRLRIVDGVTNTSEVFDNLGSIFYLKYTGDSAVAQATIANKTLSIKVGATADALTEVVSYKLDSTAFGKVSKIIADLSLHEGFEASFLPFGDKDIDSVELDEVADLDIKTPEKGGVFTGLVGDIINQTRYSNFVSASRKLDSVKELENFVSKPLTGGTDGTVPASWSKALNAIANDDVNLAYYVVPLSSQPNIHSEVATFVKEQTNQGFPLRAFVGGDKGENLTQIFTRKNRIYSDRVGLIGFSAEVRMGDGRIVEQPPYMVASMVAGLASGLGVGEPITNKPLTVISTPNALSNDQLDQLHLNGVIGISKMRSRSTGSSFRITSDVTTYTGSADPVRTTVSLGEESDFLAVGLRERLDEEVLGASTGVITASILRPIIYTYFLEKQNRQEIVGFDGGNISVAIMGNSVRISVPVIPSRGIDYIDARIIYTNDSQDSQETTTI